MSKAKKLLNELIEIYPKTTILKELLDKVEQEEFNTKKHVVTGLDIKILELEAKIKVLKDIKRGCHEYAHQHIQDKINHLDHLLSNINNPIIE